MNNHFDPFMGSKLPLELKRPLRRVKTTLLQKGRKLPLGVKTTLLNLQCELANLRTANCNRFWLVNADLLKCSLSNLYKICKVYISKIAEVVFYKPAI